jgi:hypothetical protein
MLQPAKEENMNYATLPDDMEASTIETMMTGEIAYTTPWGMWVDSQRRCWLHPKYTASRHPGGTVSMRVEKRDDGYHVWPPRGEKYQPSDEPGYMSPSDTQYLPVAELHR